MSIRRLNIDRNSNYQPNKGAIIVKHIMIKLKTLRPPPLYFLLQFQKEKVKKMLEGGGVYSPPK